MLNVITIIVSKMMSHCAGTVQVKEVSDSGTSGCNRKRSVAKWTDEYIEHPEMLMRH